MTDAASRDNKYLAGENLEPCLWSWPTRLKQVLIKSILKPRKGQLIVNIQVPVIHRDAKIGMASSRRKTDPCSFQLSINVL